MRGCLAYTRAEGDESESNFVMRWADFDELYTDQLLNCYVRKRGITTNTESILQSL